ncbi:uncharacterized protein LOC136093191 [Hydra vulgaris]|uniref:uncharacterized protein LOC136093191 n=1 Tax=Hydra vulgaris TaxID=6087 RepID=UPI0032E9CE8D
MEANLFELVRKHEEMKLHRSDSSVICTTKIWLLDTEYIHNEFTKDHFWGKNCIREICLRALNEDFCLHLQVWPCIPYKNLAEKHQKAFNHCKKYIHGLPYDPSLLANSSSIFCTDVYYQLETYFKKYPINLIFYKGGNMEVSILKCFKNVYFFDLNEFAFPKIKSMNYFYDEIPCNAHFGGEIFRREHLDHCCKYETKMLKSYLIDFIYHVKGFNEKREQYKDLVNLVRENNRCEEIYKTTCKCFDNVFLVNKTYYTDNIKK